VNEAASASVSCSRCILPYWNCWVGIAVASCGKVDDLYLDDCLTVLLCLRVVVPLQ
jgi:hypothetical protein